MKKIGVCLNCGREVYTNDINLCKRCHQEVGLDFIQEEVEEIEEEPEIEDLGLEEPTEEVKEEPAEEVVDKK